MVLAWFSCTTFMLNFNRVFFLLYWKFFLNQIIFLIFYILLSLCLFHEFQLDSHKNSDMFMTWFKDTFSLIRSFFVDVFVWKWNFIFFWGSSLVWVFKSFVFVSFHWFDSSWLFIFDNKPWTFKYKYRSVFDLVGKLWNSNYFDMFFRG